MTSEWITSGDFTLEDRRILRLFKITQSELRHALYLVFKHGCQKRKDESLKDYLTKTKNPPMEIEDYERKFDEPQRERIKKCLTGESYDVTLLWPCIKWGCDGLDQGPWHAGEDKLESLCTAVKTYRNQLCHKDVPMRDDTAMELWCTDVKRVLEKLIREAGCKYNIPDYEKEIKDLKKQIDEIRKAPLEDIKNPKKLYEEMHKLRDKAKRAVNEQGKSTLSRQYKDISKIDPASFVTGKERLHVKNLFTKLEVIRESNDESWYKRNDLEYNKILSVTTEEGKEPVVIIVEGDAGAGKTTLGKLILSDWAEGTSIFEGLRDYDLVLYGEGRNKSISSYLELIQTLMPTASYQLADDDLVHSVLQHRVLLVMDGFDELNTESEKLIKDIEKKIPRSHGKLQLLITTRPSKLSVLLNIVNPHSVLQTKLIGISVNNRTEFVSKLHDEMVNEGQSNQDTQKLIDFMKQSQPRLGDHYRLPLNLTLLTYLWASDPNKVNPHTTVTDLYIAFLELLQSRLQERLTNCMSVDVLPNEEVIGEFLQKLYSICLDTLSSGFMQLSDPSTKALQGKCEELKLPFNEMTEAFLAVEKEWTSSGYKTHLTVPHKSIMEFYAANRFMTYISNMNDTSSQSDVMLLLKKLGVSEGGREDIQKTIKKYSNSEDAKSLKKICHKLLKTDKDLTMNEKFFLHLTGLDVPEEGRKEVQRIIDKYSNPEDAKSFIKIHHKRLKTNKDLTVYEKLFLHLTGLDVPEEGREEIQKIINTYSHPTAAASLTKICHKRLKTDLTTYENMFLHLTGLLAAHQHPNMLQEYAQDLVQILRNAGFQGTKWLDVLVEAKCNEQLAGLLAPNYSGKLVVRDGHMGAALVLFKHLKTNTPIKIVVENEVSCIPQLEEMLRQLSKRDCNVEISSNHQWKHQECVPSDDPFNYVLHEEDEDHKCKVTSFTGHLETLSHLPKSLKKLRITFATTDHAHKLLKELSDLKNNYIKYLGIHVMPDVQPDSLSPLPASECTILWVSKVADNWKVKCAVIQALLPLNGMFDFLMFPQSNFSADQCREVIGELCRLKVRVSRRGGLCFSSSIIKDKELKYLEYLARDKLGCELCCMDESAIW